MFEASYRRVFSLLILVTGLSACSGAGGAGRYELTVVAMDSGGELVDFRIEGVSPQPAKLPDEVREYARQHTIPVMPSASYIVEVSTKVMPAVRLKSRSVYVAAERQVAAVDAAVFKATARPDTKFAPEAITLTPPFCGRPDGGDWAEIRSIAPGTIERAVVVEGCTLASGRLRTGLYTLLLYRDGIPHAAGTFRAKMAAAVGGERTNVAMATIPGSR